MKKSTPHVSASGELCQCFHCLHGAKALEERERKSIELFGWYSHFVYDDYKCPNNTNIHTHGFAKKFNHPDIQMCLPMQMETALAVTHCIAELLAGGKTFTAGILYDDVLGNGYKAQFIWATERGRKVLRLIIPDRNGKYEGIYADQFNKLDNK
jgi:hypothetical protein